MNSGKIRSYQVSVISFLSPKGGCGKSTACALISQEFSRLDLSSVILDTDPKRWLSSWANLKPLNSNIKVRQVDQEDLTDEVFQAALEASFVLVDVEGSSDASLIDAVLVSDFVVVPCRASRMDALGAVQVLKQVRQKSQVLRRSIPASILLNQTEPGAVEFRITGAIKTILEEAGAPIMRTQLAARPIFQAMMSLGGDYLDLPREFQGSSPKTAQANASALANELLLTAFTNNHEAA
ncbi:ParA family protein [Ruegeria sp. HKCCSP346]|uniref:ParA family protein n=1 Tax=Ruegeria sp. HKCCSP346 TaxID=2794830 RepID=UPI001AE95F4E|nr:ParA family protein [Ruegeria sp. HKCCSP346]